MEFDGPSRFRAKLKAPGTKARMQPDNVQEILLGKTESWEYWRELTRHKVG
jgi:hypothetical protein